MDNAKDTRKAITRQESSEMSAANKRLLLSAHFEFLLFKRLRRGLPIEELALLPLTVPNGWQPVSETCVESNEPVAVIASSDEDWTRRLAVAMR